MDRPSHATLELSTVTEVSSLLILGAVLGACVTWGIQKHYCDSLCYDNKKQSEHDSVTNNTDSCLVYEERKRKRLPDLVILVRHGQSEGNVDKKMWWKKLDCEISLTSKGIEQAKEVGKRIENIFQQYEQELGISMEKVHIHASPFERTLQTARFARASFIQRVVRQNSCPRLREQEFGNTQSADCQVYREEQKRVGRFWYRFPTGESGADVYDRIKSWWEDSLMTTNERWGYERVNAVVVFSHGLALRFCLMQLYSWSPTTFHTVYNVDNCGIHVLRKNLSIPGSSPYVLDAVRGDVPKSSIDVLVTLQRSHGKEKVEETITFQKIFKLRDYLNIPPPRMTRIGIIKEKLAEQFPDEIASPDNILSISFQTFTWRQAPDLTSTISEKSTVPNRKSVMAENVEESSGQPNHCSESNPDAVPEESHRWPIAATY